MMIPEYCPPPNRVRILDASFFNRDATIVAQDLVGKQIQHKTGCIWLEAQIIETEAYYRTERGSHASLGRTPSRESLWAAAGTIYIYHSQGGDSLNVSVKGDGNAVLIKAAWVGPRVPDEILERMQANSPGPRDLPRPRDKLCSGQALLCRALAIRRADWDGLPYGGDLRITNTGGAPLSLIRTRRLGIRRGRDAHLMYRFVDPDHVHQATRNPLSVRDTKEGKDFHWIRRSRGGWRVLATPELHNRAVNPMEVE